jgi:anthranilate/para-aminobenzoate synthase component I
VKDGHAWFHVGAGIVADSVPAAEYEETLAKAGGLLAALEPDGRVRPPSVNARPEPNSVE